MGQCVSKPPDGMDYAAAAAAAGGGGGGRGGTPQGRQPPGGHAAAAAATYDDVSAHQQHTSLAKRSLRTSNRSVVESLASIYQVKTVLGSGGSVVG